MTTYPSHLYKVRLRLAGEPRQGFPLQHEASFRAPNAETAKKTAERFYAACGYRVTRVYCEKVVR